MKEQTEEQLTENSIAEGDIEELHLVGERAHVARDTVSVKDDASDYKFIKVKSSHKHSSQKSAEGAVKHKRRKRKRMKTWKKAVLIAVSVLLVLVLAVGGTFLYLRGQGQGELLTDDVNVLVPETVQASVQDDGDFIVYKGQTYRLNKNITSLLFMGVDKRNLEEKTEEGTGGQADVLVVIALDMKTHKTTMTALPRDTFTEVAMYTPAGNYNGMKNTQVCLAYAYGDGKETSCDNTLASVRRIFYNIPIKTYYALDLDGIAAVNDAVGGVDAVSPETIEKFTEGQSYHLMGNDAERFVRARVHDRVDANMLRLERQKVYAKGFLSQMLSSIKHDLSSAVRIFNDSAPYSCTNLNAARVTYLASELAFGSKPKTEMQTVPGEMAYDGGVPRFNVNEEQFFEQFLSVYYEKM